MRTVYQLHATGSLAFFGTKHTLVSGSVYAKKEAAEAAIPAFRRKSTTPDQKDPRTLTCLSDDGTLTIRIVPLDLVED